MRQSSKHTTSGASWTRDFFGLYHAARYSEAARLYAAKAGTAPSSELALAGARAYMVADPARAMNVLHAVHPVPRRLRVERDMLLGEAAARTWDFATADSHLASALEAARRLEDAELVAEVGYRYVRRYLFENAPDKARSFLTAARSGRSRAARLNAQHAEAYILGYEERFEDQARCLVELLRSLEPDSTEFLHHRAWATHTLAVLARELYLPDAIPEAERHLAGAWNEDFAFNRFQALKALGWAKALQGDYFNAFRNLRQASADAPSPAWESVAACDRAYLARCVNEPRWSRHELDAAENAAERTSWAATQGEERIGLLLLAELFAPIDSPKAAMYLARYRELGRIRSPLHRRDDPRFRALEQYATGVIESALGSHKRGLAELRAAFKTFDRLGYQWRAARCLLTEFTLARQPRLLDLAEERLHRYPQSWLAADLRRLSPGTREVVLPPRQRRVFEELCQGKSNRDIARALGRSRYTINNQVQEIFKAFNVSSRAALMAEAARRGILVPD